MRILNIVAEDFSNYRCGSGKPCLFVGIGTCDWKCCREAGVDLSICQNSELAKTKPKIMSAKSLCDKYLGDYVGGIVVGGLEPFRDKTSLCELLLQFASRRVDSDFVVYTGYNESEIDSVTMNWLITFVGKNRLILKFGRFVPNSKPVFDDVLGVELASDNQYGKVMCDNRPHRFN